MDNNLYLTNPEILEPPSYGTYSVARYQVTTDTLETISFSPSITPTTSPSERRIVGVDEMGNILIYILWNDNSSTHFELMKLDPTGMVLWHVTENELGNAYLLLKMVNEDTFLFKSRNTPNLLGVVSLQIFDSKP